jgi:hypothetical protein
MDAEREKGTPLNPMPPSTYDVVADLEAQAAHSHYMPGSDRYIHIIDAWEELVGPSRGTLVLPAHLSEYDGETAELDPALLPEVHRLYERVINFGTAQDQAALLNAALLRAHWTLLPLSDEVRAAWESRFPQLDQAACRAD